MFLMKFGLLESQYDILSLVYLAPLSKIQCRRTSMMDKIVGKHFTIKTKT